jgi:hypothetical protein
MTSNLFNTKYLDRTVTDMAYKTIVNLLKIKEKEWQAGLDRQQIPLVFLIVNRFNSMAIPMRDRNQTENLLDLIDQAKAYRPFKNEEESGQFMKRHNAVGADLSGQYDAVARYPDDSEKKEKYEAIFEKLRFFIRVKSAVLHLRDQVALEKLEKEVAAFKLTLAGELSGTRNSPCTEN